MSLHLEHYLFSYTRIVCSDNARTPNHAPSDEIFLIPRQFIDALPSNQLICRSSIVFKHGTVSEQYVELAVIGTDETPQNHSCPPRIFPPDFCYRYLHVPMFGTLHSAPAAKNPAGIPASNFSRVETSHFDRLHPLDDSLNECCLSYSGLSRYQCLHVFQSHLAILFYTE